jgi:hypothetical protein
MNDPLRNPFLNPRLSSFGRLTFDGIHGPEFGVGRVWYQEGHRQAGHVEVERRDGSPALVPVESCQVGANWDDTPKGGRFTGSELYRPAFLDDTGKRFLRRDHSVIIPGDMKRARALLERVRPGWTVDWFSHGCNEFRGVLTVTEAHDGHFSLTGGKNAPTRYTWPEEHEEFDIEGDRLTEIRVHEARTGKPPSRSLTLKFQEGVIR